ncbi:hypothetical protein VHUM_00081 [Vanrija humicola]|uniref:Uncharacterized protein n=1 Tax=Vanrija humicola TaxID=5417 RepID=A0A7D8Z2X9_VANHU|nr:hypothetical protein VHUM_00081 [Vanrija humicola]
MSAHTPTPTTATDQPTGAEETAPGAGYSFSSSTIVRVAIAAGIIVIAISALVVFVKVTTWIRYRQRLNRTIALRNQLAAEEQARAFEMAAWSDVPGQAPVEGNSTAVQPRPAEKDKAGAHRRGRTNAYAVHEWEGVPQ